MSAGRGAPKYVIGNRALLAVIDRLEAFARAESAAQLTVGLFVFRWARVRARPSRLGKFDAGELRHWAKSFIAPRRTDAARARRLQMAGDAVLEKNATQRHVLVITDGENTAGPDPATVIARLNKKAASKDGMIAFHFIAFDVNANVFRAIKEQGATRGRGGR